MSINELVVAALPELLAQRQAEGLAHYGQPLRSWNGRHACQDLVEEMVDGLQYAVQVQIEHQDLLRVLRELALFHAAAGSRGWTMLDPELVAMWESAHAAVGTLPREVVFPGEAAPGEAAR